MDDDALLAELGVETRRRRYRCRPSKHVKPRAEIRAAEEIANRTACKDFERFKPLFAQYKRTWMLASARRADFKPTRKSTRAIFSFSRANGLCGRGRRGLPHEQDRIDARLRVIFDNGTESDNLLRSLQRALYKDETGRRITDPSPGPCSAEPTNARRRKAARSMSCAASPIIPRIADASRRHP